jgi:hypothetical protein
MLALYLVCKSKSVVEHALFKAWTAFVCSNSGVRGFVPHSKHGCKCVHSVFVLSCVYVVDWRRVDPPSKESYRLPIAVVFNLFFGYSLK